MTTLQIILTIAVIWNILVFLLYGLDKRLSVKNTTRVPESLLIFCSFLVGGIGALAGMFVFHHKTRTDKFKKLIPIAFIITVVLIVLAFIFIK